MICQCCVHNSYRKFKEALSHKKRPTSSITLKCFYCETHAGNLEFRKTTVLLGKCSPLIYLNEPAALDQ